MIRFLGDCSMRQAQTLNEAQLRRVIQYCRSRRHPTRDQTIILFSFYAGLRAKEIAALKRGDVFDDEGNARTQFTLSAEQGRQDTHCVPKPASTPCANGLCCRIELARSQPSAV